MCKIIAIANQKGGVAKTTTTINLGVGLSKVGKRVMLIDADPQGHLTMGLGFPKNLRVTLKTMMENIIMGLEFDPREAILHHEEGIDVIPSNKLLSGMDMSLFTVEDREKVLKEYLELLENDYDYILIDCMPSLGMMTINALSAADSVLIPVQPQYYAADGLMELLKEVKELIDCRLQEKNISLDVFCEPKELVKKFDQDLMISVVTNLIDNAVKASRKESKIVLEATPDHLMVQDFGKGIPKEDLEMVTEPFYMVDKSRSRAKGSVGLGLSLCQKIIELHDFHLKIESNPGKGTTVSVFW